MQHVSELSLPPGNQLNYSALVEGLVKDLKSTAGLSQTAHPSPSSSLRKRRPPALLPVCRNGLSMQGSLLPSPTMQCSQERDFKAVLRESQRVNDLQRGKLSKAILSFEVVFLHAINQPILYIPSYCLVAPLRHLR